MTTSLHARVFESVTLPLSKKLRADIHVPATATSLIIFAHGSGSSRLSPRNQWVAGQLQSAGFATLLFDLLTLDEDSSPGQRFDIALLADRLVEATEWATTHPDTRDLRVGYFGASTGAAAALIAASVLPETVRAIVSRGGRPDLADEIRPARARRQLRGPAPSRRRRTGPAERHAAVRIAA